MSLRNVSHFFSSVTVYGGPLVEEIYEALIHMAHDKGRSGVMVFDKNVLSKKRTQTRSRGFSLMEIMVAFVLGLIAVLTLLGIFPSGITSIQESADSIQAQAIGQAYLDYIREYYQTQTGVPAGFPASGTSFTCTPGSVQPLQFRGVTQTQMAFSCVYTYSNVAVGSTPEHRIDFTVSWSSEQRGTQSRTYEEYVIN